MRICKLLAAAVLSASLYACDNCEDVSLGRLEFTNELASFLPAQDQRYYATVEGARRHMSYHTPAEPLNVIIPVRKTHYSGKFDPSACKEYYTAQEKEYTSQIEGENRFSIKVIYRKDAATDQYNPIQDKDEVGDAIAFVAEYNNVFPEPVPYGTTTIQNFVTRRIFTFTDATSAKIDDIVQVQEFLPTIILNGVAHQNVYHRYTTQQPYFEAHEPSALKKYPLDYVQGIYIKEGIGLIHAYTYRGKQIDVAAE